MKNNERAIFGGGCFWCTEAIFKSLKGVESVLPGYIGGSVENPTYEEVCTGNTGHAEAVEIIYDPNEVNYLQLLEIFFATHNPTTLNRQGEDVGTQYRSEVFYVNQAQKDITQEYIANLEIEKIYDDPIVTQISKARVFYVAEDYHKNYVALRGEENRYCQLVVIPKLNKFKEKYREKLK
ncbi:MAG: peptide-methionine (S)-S-oxide reductase MsrA [Flavobacteriaceae bacterium]|nr:peptide-methionine (S)-S-oxide reductase MsrA [Flavobacteriaceae bacterium]